MPYDNKNELFFWVDENDVVLGSMTRGEAHSGTKKIHRSIYVLIFNSKNEVLMQRRSMYKDTYPRFWTVSVSGHATYPHTYRKTLKREVKEELGLTLKEYKPMGKILYESDKEKEFGQVYFGYSDKQRILFDTTEISEVEWVPVEKLKLWSETHPLTPAAQQVLSEMKVGTFE